MRNNKTAELVLTALFAAIIIIMAVSYTHLDVYKRQHLDIR